jgi:hypothetical protein
MNLKPHARAGGGAGIQDTPKAPSHAPPTAHSINTKANLTQG